MEDTVLIKATARRTETRALDRAAFEELYVTYLPKVYNYVRYRVGDDATAEDVTSEVFERALTRLGTYRSDRGAFSTWLFSIAHNQVANHLRTRHRRPVAEMPDELPAGRDGAASLEESAANADLLRRIWSGMQRLPEQQQEVLALKFGWGLANQEIAASMRLSSNHVGVLVHRAVRALRRLMDNEEAIK